MRSATLLIDDVAIRKGERMMASVPRANVLIDLEVGAITVSFPETRT